MTLPTEALRAQLLELIETLDDRSLDSLREDGYIGDRFDAPDDCETIIYVTRGELRKMRAAAAALSGQEELPETGTITNCHCGRCHCGHSPEGAPVHALGCCVKEHREAAVREWQRAMRERDDEVKLFIEENNKLRAALAGPPPEQEPMDISDELHRILTAHRVPSRTQTDVAPALVAWAARACRQSQALAASSSQWQSVKSPPPQEREDVLVVNRNTGNYAIGYIRYAKDGSSTWTTGSVYIYPTHWMPLPEPPKVTT